MDARSRIASPIPFGGQQPSGLPDRVPLTIRACCPSHRELLPSLDDMYTCAYTDHGR